MGKPLLGQLRAAGLFCPRLPHAPGGQLPKLLGRRVRLFDFLGLGFGFRI